jgi:hypothetical protein
MNVTNCWRIAGGGGSGGGALATASNLVFQVIHDVRFLAYAAEDGRKLLEIPTGQTGMGPPITYELDGKQYVAFMGGTGQAGRGNAASPPRFYVLVLDGKERIPEPERNELSKCRTTGMKSPDAIGHP